jgi:hypothetical protein
VSNAARMALVVVAVLVTLAAAVTVCLILVSHEISSSDHDWCAAIDLLTARPIPYPADPAKNPSRVATYDLYEDFVTLRHQYGC